MEYLKVNELEEGYLYYIKARNANFGIWFKTKRGFLIRRTKFYHVSIFTEIHWDLSEHFGTVKPLLKLEQSPFNVSHIKYELNKEGMFYCPKELEILSWLEEKEKYWIAYV